MYKSQRKCKLCPTAHIYEYCTSCIKKEDIIQWKLQFDTENCRDVYKVLSEFAFGRLSANDAKRQLDKLEVPNKEDMQLPLRKNYEDVLSQATKEEPKKLDSIKETSYSSTYEPKEEVEEVKSRRRRSFRRNYD